MRRLGNRPEAGGFRKPRVSFLLTGNSVSGVRPGVTDPGLYFIARILKVMGCFE